MKTIHSAKYQIFLQMLISARKEAGVTQAELAKRLNRVQSYVSKVEIGERRMDVIEFLEYAKQIGADAHLIIDCLLDQD